MSFKKDIIAAAVLYLLRMAEAVSLSITTFCVCYLVWMHRNHYCHDSWCSPGRLQNTSVPIGEVMMIVACVVVGLEFLFSSGFSVLSPITGKRLDSFTQLCTSASALGVFTLCLLAYASTPTVHQSWPLCWDMYHWNWYDAPEQYQCILTQCSVTFGLITWIAIMAITGFAIYDFRRDRGVGSIRLVEDAPGAVDIGGLQPAESGST